MKHTTSRMLFAYWDGLRGERVAPERADLQPGAMRQVLADAFVLEREDGSPAALRLAGTRLCALFGRDLSGVPFSSLWPIGNADAADLLDVVMGEACGVVTGLVGTNREGMQLTLELLLLPLRHRGRIDRRALGVLSPSTVPSWAGLLPIERLDTRSVRVIDARQEKGVLSGPTPAAIVGSRPVLVVHQGGRV